MKLILRSYIGAKLIGSFLIIVAISALIVFIAYNQFSVTERLVSDKVLDNANVLHLNAQIILKSSSVFRLVNNYFLTGEETKRAALRIIINDHIDTLGEYLNQVKNRALTNKEAEIFNQIEELFCVYTKLAKTVLESHGMEDGKGKEGEAGYTDYGFREAHLRFITLLQNFNNIETELIHNSWDFIKNRITTTKTLILTFSIAALVLGIFFGIVSTKMVTSPVGKLTNILEDMSRGDIGSGIDIKSRDEFGKMGASFNRFVEYLQGAISVLEGITAGDYSRSVQVRGSKDILGNAINQMTTTLKEAIRQQEEQTFLKTGQTELNDRIRGGQDIAALSHNVVTFLANYLNAKVGTVYLVDEEGLLKLTGVYAAKKGNFSNEFKFGEGVVGQAALDKKHILVTDVPNDYVMIHSGLGEAAPHNTLVMPFIYEGKTKGVIELGSFDEFTDIQIRFLKEVSDNIAIAFNTTQSSLRVDKLLSDSRVQSRDLQARQKELRQANKELEKRVRAIDRQK